MIDNTCEIDSKHLCVSSVTYDLPVVDVVADVVVEVAGKLLAISFTCG